MIPTVRSGGGVGLVRVSLPGAGRAPTTVRTGRGVGLVRVSLPGSGRAPTMVRSGGGVGLVRVSLPGAGRALTTVRSGGGVGLVRVSLPGAGRAPTTVHGGGGGVGLVRASLTGAGRTVGRLPLSRANFGKPAEQGPAGHLKGAALAGLLTCYKPAVSDPSTASDPSSLNNATLHQKLDVLLEQTNQLHKKLDGDMMGIRRLLWRITSAVVSVCFVLLTTVVLYILTDGRVYLEAELNKLAMGIFFRFANDAKVKKTMQTLIKEGVDTTVYHIVSLSTWFKWLRRR